MRNFILSIAQKSTLENLDIIAAAVCTAIALISTAVYILLRKNPCRAFIGRSKAFEKKEGRVTQSNALRYAKKVLKPCGRLAYNTFLFNLRSEGVTAAGRAAAPYVAESGGIKGSFFTLALADILLTACLFALCGYPAGGVAVAGIGIAAVWAACAAAYICANALLSRMGKRAGEKAAERLLLATAPVPVSVQAAIAENPAYVEKSELDKLFKQVDDILSAGVGKQMAAVVLGGIDGMLESNLYCGAEKLRLTALRERVKKYCA